MPRPIKLRLKRMGEMYWIVGDEEDGPYGPYKTKTEANEDRRGLQRTFDHWDDPSFVTTVRQETN